MSATGVNVAVAAEATGALVSTAAVIATAVVTTAEATATTLTLRVDIRTKPFHGGLEDGLPTLRIDWHQCVSI